MAISKYELAQLPDHLQMTYGAIIETQPTTLEQLVETRQRCKTTIWKHVKQLKERKLINEAWRPTKDGKHAELVVTTC